MTAPRVLLDRAVEVERERGREARLLAGRGGDEHLLVRQRRRVLRGHDHVRAVRQHDHLLGGHLVDAGQEVVRRRVERRAAVDRVHAELAEQLHQPGPADDRDRARARACARRRACAVEIRPLHARPVHVRRVRVRRVHVRRVWVRPVAVQCVHVQPVAVHPVDVRAVAVQRGDRRSVRVQRVAAAHGRGASRSVEEERRTRHEIRA